MLRIGRYPPDKQEKATQTVLERQKREKQIERFAGCMVAIVGDLQGIGDGALPQLDAIAALPAPQGLDEYAPA